MLCPFCFETTDDGFKRHLPCTETLLNVPERLDRILVKVGYWECDECGWTKPIYKKQPIEQSHLIKSASCLCCDDSGAVLNFLVREYILPDYQASDPPVRCQRCKAGIASHYVWDIATREDCDRFHRLRVSQSFNQDQPVPDINQLSQKISMRSNYGNVSPTAE